MRRARRKARYDEVKALYGQGLGIRAIARVTGLNRKTVMKFVHASEFPEASRRYRKSKLDPFKGYMDQRWQAGCHQGTRLIEEVRALGYKGSQTVATDYIAKLRRTNIGKDTDDQSVGPGTNKVQHSPQISAKQAS